MTDTLPNITLPQNAWVDLYDATGIEVGTALSIENIGSHDIYVAVQADEPSAEPTAYNVINRKNGVRLQNNEGDSGAWAYCQAAGAKLNVQPEADTGFYPNIGVMLKTADGEKASDDNPSPFKDIDYKNRMSLNTLFGEKIQATRQAKIAAQFQYGFPAGAAEPETANGGSISIVESMLTVSSGVDPAGSASIANKKALRYVAGQEAFLYFTCVFTAAQVDSYQRAGIFNDDNGFFLGYNGTDFCVTRRRDGVDYHTVIDPSVIFSENDGVYDPTKGNVYRTTFGYLGFAPIHFEVMAPCGCWRSVHRIEYPNSATVTHVLNTNLQPRGEVANIGNTSDMSIKIGSFSAGIMDGGNEDAATRLFSHNVTDQIIASVSHMAVTFRSKTSFAGLINYIQSIFSLVSFNVTSNKVSQWVLEKNATLVGGTWTDVDTSDSTIEYSIDAAVTIGTGDSSSFTLNLRASDRELITDFENQRVELLPGEHITLFIISSSGVNGNYGFNFRWKELF